MSLVLSGRCWKVGDNVPNDGGVMPFEHAARLEFDPKVLTAHCLEDVRPEFPRLVQPGDIVVAGQSFGCGSFHAQGPIAMKALGVGIVSASMSRGFFRLCVANGLPMLPFARVAAAALADGERLRVDFSSGRVDRLDRGETLTAEPLPDFLLEMIARGSELAWMKERGLIPGISGSRDTPNGSIGKGR